MKKWRICCLVLLLALLPQAAWAKPAEEFRLIGYYSEGPFDEPLENLQLDKLTHVMYAFLLPKADGTLTPIAEPENLRRLVARAHEQGAKVFIAIGGWSDANGVPLASTFEALAASEETRQAFVANVLDFVREYDLDGVEIDWEYPTVASQADYEALVVALGAGLKAEGRELTAALNGGWSATEGPEVSELVTEKCLETFCFINVMCYDTNDADHSPVWFTDTSISYWLNRGLRPEQIVVGIPLYARPSWAQYRHLVAADAENAYGDFVPAGDAFALDSHYNGLNTIAEKTAIALTRAGGVMLFDVNEDTNDQYSVVSAIDKQIAQAAAMSDEALARNVLVFLDNRPLGLNDTDGFGQAYVDENNRVLLPLRKPLEAIGAEVVYDEATETITITREDTVVEVVVNQAEITVNGQTVPMDTRAVVKDGRTYLPARAVFEAFGYQLDWREVSRSLYLNR